MGHPAYATRPAVAPRRRAGFRRRPGIAPRSASPVMRGVPVGTVAAAGAGQAP